MNAIYHGSTKRCRNKFLTFFLNTGKNIRLTRLRGEQISNDTVTSGWCTDALTFLQLLFVWIVWTDKTPDVGHGSQQRAFRETLWRCRLLCINNINRYRDYIAFDQHRHLLYFIFFVIWLGNASPSRRDYRLSAAGKDIAFGSQFIFYHIILARWIELNQVPDGYHVIDFSLPFVKPLWDNACWNNGMVYAHFTIIKATVLYACFSIWCCNKTTFRKGF